MNPPECDKAITQCNEVLCAQQVLVDSDSRRPSLLAAYASQVVIGAGFSYIMEDGGRRFDDHLCN